MNSADSLITVSIGFGNAAEAEAVAWELVERRLAACAQVWPMRSVYRRQGVVEEANEIMLLAKTTAAALPAVGALVLESHSYEVPEIVAQPIQWATEVYAQWIRESVDGVSGR